VKQTQHTQIAFSHPRPHSLKRQQQHSYRFVLGGSIKLGESTIDAAQRELSEETRFETTIQKGDIIKNENKNDSEATVQLSWYQGGAFTTSDAIFASSSSSSSSNEEESNDLGKTVKFHYLIAQCFAQVVIANSTDPESALPKVYPADDADDAKWWTMEEIMDQRDKTISGGVDAVIVRAESLQDQGLLVPYRHE
jgi:ADP-ribose pyrophosphatase YjhB (NUDIX family)